MSQSKVLRPHERGAVIEDVLAERGLKVGKLRALLALIEHDGCWGCVPGTPACEEGAHLHTVLDRTAAVWFAARAARRELEALLGAVGSDRPT